MKIQHVMTQTVELPASEPLADGPTTAGATRPFVVVEYMPWTRDLFDSPPVPNDSIMHVPAEAGLGSSFTRAIDTGFKVGR